MKSLVIFLFSVLLAGFVLSSCKDDNVTYAEELATEQKIISDFIKRNGISVVTTMPSQPWPAKVFYKSPSGLYFRLTNAGDTQSNDTVESGDLIVPRYIQYTLTAKPDTLFNLSTTDFEYPSKFNYLDFTQACVGWHEAVGYMKRHNSEASILVFSRIGFTQFNRPATPIGYDLKIKIQKNY